MQGWEAWLWIWVVGRTSDMLHDCVPLPAAVHADDPEFRAFSDISELPQHRLQEIRRWAAGAWAGSGLSMRLLGHAACAAAVS